VDAGAAESANGTRVLGWQCHGGRNQGWWYDPARGTLHTELTQDRCLDVPDTAYPAGTGLVLWNCHGGTHQKFVRDGATIRPTAARGLCLTLAGPSEPLRIQKCDGSANQHFA
jgi:hypothetical protein